MKPERAEAVLKWLLIVFGVMAATAVVPMVMPFAWMQAANDWLGLEPVIDTPLTQYLTRSLSALYALLGILTIYWALDVRHHRELLILVGWLTAALGIALTWIDFAAHLPLSWTLSEGPPTVVFGCAIVWLARQVRPA